MTPKPSFADYYVLQFAKSNFFKKGGREEKSTNETIQLIFFWSLDVSIIYVNVSLTSSA